MSEQEKIRLSNFRLELEQLSLWNRHGETTLWTVGSVLGTASFYALLKVIDCSISNPKIILFISFSFIVVLLIFILYYTRIVIRSTFRMTRRMRRIDRILQINFTQSLENNTDNNNENNETISIIRVYLTPFGLLFFVMSFFNITGWSYYFYINLCVLITN